MYVCMYLCMYVCMYVCRYVIMYVSMYVLYMFFIYKYKCEPNNCLESVDKTTVWRLSE